jgi:hypothetical protein
MKTLFVLLILVTFQINQVTGQTFDGVEVSGNYIDVVKKFKAKDFKESYEGDNSIVLDGKTLNKNISLVIAYTPKTKQAYQFTIIFEKETSQLVLKKEFDNFVELFTEKYGQPVKNESNETYKYFSIWNKVTYYISLAVTEKDNIMIGYHNTVNSEICKKEKKELEKETF